MHAQEIDLYAALADGVYRYDPKTHQLSLAMASDVRRVTGYQDFVDIAGLGRRSTVNLEEAQP